MVVVKRRDKTIEIEIMLDEVRMCEASDAMRLPSNVLKVSSILKN